MFCRLDAIKRLYSTKRKSEYGRATHVYCDTTVGEAESMNILTCLPQVRMVTITIEYTKV